MPAPSGNKPVARSPSSRLSELGLVLPAPPTPLGAYVESSDAGGQISRYNTLRRISDQNTFQESNIEH
jgi:hypothetical protein